MALSLKEAIARMQIEEAVPLLADICEGLLKRFEVQRGPQGLAGPAGKDSTIPGPKGDKGDQGPPADLRDVVAAAKKNVIEIVRAELFACGGVDAEGRWLQIPGEPGRDGKDSTVPGPQGARGLAAKIQLGSVSSGETASVSLREKDGVQILDLVLPRGEKGDTGAASAIPGPKGDTGDTGTVGPRGEPSNIPGPQGSQGPSGATLAEIEQLVRDVIGSSANDALRQLVALRSEIAQIANDARYQRIDGPRKEIITRLTACQEIEPVRVVYVQTPPSPPPPPPPLPATRFEWILRSVGLIR